MQEFCLGHNYERQDHVAPKCFKKEFYDKINFDIIDECTKIVLSKYNNFDCKIFKNNTFN